MQLVSPMPAAHASSIAPSAPCTLVPGPPFASIKHTSTHLAPQFHARPRMPLAPALGLPISRPHRRPSRGTACAGLWRILYQAARNAFTHSTRSFSATCAQTRCRSVCRLHPYPVCQCSLLPCSSTSLSDSFKGSPHLPSTHALSVLDANIPSMHVSAIPNITLPRPPLPWPCTTRPPSVRQ